MKKLIIIIQFLILSLYLHSQNQADRGFITFNFYTCDGQPPEYIYAMITGDTLINDTIQELTLYTPGFYDIYLSAPGYVPVDLGNFYYTGDKTVNVYFTVQLFPPRKTQIDSLSSTLIWEKPRINAINENFSDEPFPPVGWTTIDDKWQKTLSGSGGSFIVPEWNSSYACINDTLNFQPDTLITSALDLANYDNYSLSFDSYYDGQGNQASVIYSLDGGMSYQLLSDIIPASEWQHTMIDLSEFSGIAGQLVWIGFTASQWAIDNVEVSDLEDTIPCFSGYHVFLNDSLVSETTDTSYQFEGLEYGETYTASVGALYTSGLSEKLYETFTSVFLYPPNNLVAATYDNAVHLIWEPPLMPDTSGVDFCNFKYIQSQLNQHVPENLLGFNLYKNDEFLDYVEYEEGQSQIEYWDYNVDPGCHTYEVSGIYDLYPYGSPGDTAESAICGPVIVCGGVYFILPFIEDWEAGTFENRYWSATSDNWSVNTSFGNPGNSADFSGSPELNEYSHVLKSYFLDGLYVTDGKIILECQVKLQDLNENASEKLIVGVEANDGFYPLDVMENAGTTEWLNLQYDLTDYATGSYFQIVFRAEGENSTNIEGWFIDNIHVYQLCDEPTDLSLVPQFGTEYSIAVLDWEPPAMPYHWLFYHDNTFENGVSAMEPGYGFAQLFEPEEYPASIQKVRFFVDGHLNHQNFIDVSLLSGDGNSVLAGPVSVQAVDENSWITVNFGEISIEEGNFLVYIENNQENGPFIAVDDHQESPKLYYGSPGNFTELSQWGYYMISSCEAYVKHAPSDHLVQNSKGLKPESMNFSPHISFSGKIYQAEKKNNQRGLFGYNIWRNNELIEVAWPESQYSDTLYETGEYSYYISAVYDQCESDTLGMVSISLFTDIPDASNQNQINIYPNPASDQLIIETEAQDAIIHHFTLTSVSGQPVVSLSPDNRRIRLDVSLLPEGIYLAEIFSGGKREFRKIIIY